MGLAVRGILDWEFTCDMREKRVNLDKREPAASFGINFLHWSSDFWVYSISFNQV